MAYRNRDACGRQRLRIPNRCDVSSPYERGDSTRSLGEELENQNITFHNVMLLAEALDTGKPYTSTTDEMGGILCHQREYSARIYVDKTTGRMVAIKFMDQPDPETVPEETHATVMFRATVYEEVSMQPEEGLRHTELGLQFDPILTSRAQLVLDETLQMYNEQ